MENIMDMEKDSGGRINGTKSVESFCYISIDFIDYLLY